MSGVRHHLKSAGGLFSKKLVTVTSCQICSILSAFVIYVILDSILESGGPGSFFGREIGLGGFCIG